MTAAGVRPQAATTRRRPPPPRATTALPPPRSAPAATLGAFTTVEVENPPSVRTAGPHGGVAR